MDLGCSAQNRGAREGVELVVVRLSIGVRSVLKVVFVLGGVSGKKVGAADLASRRPQAVSVPRHGEPGCPDRVATVALRSVSQNGPEVVGRCVSVGW